MKSFGSVAAHVNGFGSALEQMSREIHERSRKALAVMAWRGELEGAMSDLLACSPAQLPTDGPLAARYAEARNKAVELMLKKPA